MAGDDWKGTITRIPHFERPTDSCLVYDLGLKFNNTDTNTDTGGAECRVCCLPFDFLPKHVFRRHFFVFRFHMLRW